MGDCAYCGKPAGLMRSIHKDCAARRDQARSDIDLAFQNLMLVEKPPAPAIFRAIIERLGADGQLTSDELRSKVLAGLAISLDVALIDLNLSQTEVQRLDAVAEAFSLDASAFDEAGIKDKLVKALVLKDLSEGRPRRGSRYPLRFRLL